MKSASNQGSINGFAISLGHKILVVARVLGGMGILVQQVIRDLFRRPLYIGLISEQIYQIGIRSIGIVFVTAMSTGMVMALQFGIGLEKFGGKLYVPKIVSLSIVREMGPVFCSLMLAARVGAGIASEIGSMVVTQQIDAIRALGTSPIKRIVIPRILACLISLPLLCTFGNIIGIAGSTLVAATELGLDPTFALRKVFETVTITDYMTGVLKTVFFALFIGVTSCFYGLRVSSGTRGVGMATTQSVVVSSILVLVGDFFLTKAFVFLFEK